MTLAALLLLAAFAEPGATAPAGAAGAEPKKEKLICRRVDATESRMASQRVCKTAQQWKEEQPGEDNDRLGGRDSRFRRN
jgi:hypothetical protein